MDVFKAIEKRRSIRKYKDKEVEEDKIFKILEAARQAPSASNCQEWRFVVVKDKVTRSKLCHAAKEQTFIAQAPVVIVCCAETDSHLMACGQACYPIDLAIAIDHMSLTAVELGLGSCWIGAFYEQEVKKILDIPKEIRVVEMLVLGYSSQYSFDPKVRLDLEEIAFFEKWGFSK